MPSVLPSGDDSSAQEQALRARFHKFWMASVADAFGDDLKEIRKVRPKVWYWLSMTLKSYLQEPNMTTSRLAMLIDSLASGEDVFSPSAHPDSEQDVNEMAIVLDTGVHTDK
jgi:ribosome assembly protein 3